MVRYLSRYTRKIALSESRLIALSNETVTFRYKDYRDHKNKQQTLKGVEFVRHFLQHVLPLGLMRIRHYGWLSNASGKKKLAQVRKAIYHHDHAKNNRPSKRRVDPTSHLKKRFEGIDCPCCKKSMMKIIRILLPLKMTVQGFT